MKWKKAKRKIGLLWAHTYEKGSSTSTYFLLLFFLRKKDLQRLGM